MKTKMITLVSLLATFLFLSTNCERNSDTIPALSKNLTIGDTTIMKPQVIYRDEASAFQVVFDSIVEDSRCPANVNCVWEGNAKATISVNSDDQQADIVLNTHPDYQQTARIGDYDIQLLDVLPYPQSDITINATDYAIQVFISGVKPHKWHHGKVVDYTGLDGCGLLVELDDGTRLEPAVVEPDVELKAGQEIVFQYEEMEGMGSICMTGPIVRITAIQPQHCDQALVPTGDRPLDSFPSAPIQLQQAWLSNDCLHVKYGHSGGCKEHQIALVHLESSAKKAVLFLSHEDNGDMCEAYITGTLSFHVQPLIDVGIQSVEIRTEPDRTGTFVGLTGH